jgi:hypothetical protein
MHSCSERLGSLGGLAVQNPEVSAPLRLCGSMSSYVRQQQKRGAPLIAVRLFLKQG